MLTLLQTSAFYYNHMTFLETAEFDLFDVSRWNILLSFLGSSHNILHHANTIINIYHTLLLSHHITPTYLYTCSLNNRLDALIHHTFHNSDNIHYIDFISNNIVIESTGFNKLQ